jgi:hypothetical protein
MNVCDHNCRRGKHVKDPNGKGTLCTIKKPCPRFDIFVLGKRFLVLLLKKARNCASTNAET